ncbi:hypothetical protein VNO77_08842 [Canavalia gladiata]|uniref:Uncharacterized protein n=1 Tax=Canavalia gladiata TaxID=3824 RepID=A0AAN9MAB4_CANGL
MVISGYGTCWELTEFPILWLKWKIVERGIRTGGERKVKVSYMIKSMRPEIDATGPYKGQLVPLPKTLNTGYRLVLFPGGMINLSQDANKTQDLMRLYCYGGLGTWTNLLIKFHYSLPDVDPKMIKTSY